MSGYENYLQMQDLTQEIQDLTQEIQVLGPDHPDTPHLTELLEKSENELQQLVDLDVVVNWSSFCSL